jgi:hypothetical protein
LLLFEMSELALYNIDRELRILIASEGLTVDVVPLLRRCASQAPRARNPAGLWRCRRSITRPPTSTCRSWRQNAIEGIYNNLFSTWNAAEAAL